MTILGLLQQDGNQLKKVSNTHGGEYAGPCPFCGGDDRFRVWPEQDRFWCRQCGKAGDSIQYLRDTKGMTYMQACDALRAEPRVKPSTRQERAVWTPRETITPQKTWQEKASAFLAWTEKHLQENGNVNQWLNNDRGLTEETIKQAHLGWNPKDLYRDRNTWGLEDIGKKLWLPGGLVIPYQVEGKLIRLRIRRPDPGKGARYPLVPGSDTKAMILPGPNKAVVVVESELDAILLHQEAGDIVTTVSLGNAQTRPDEKTHSLLGRAEEILLSLDSDKAGVKETLVWWKGRYPAKWWPVPEGKDPAEAMQVGIDLKTWIMAGLDKEPSKIQGRP